jgi:hypothetical protein
MLQLPLFCLFLCACAGGLCAQSTTQDGKIKPKNLLGLTDGKAVSAWRTPPVVWIEKPRKTTQPDAVSDEINILRETSETSAQSVIWAASRNEASALLVLDVDRFENWYSLSNLARISQEDDRRYIPESLRATIDFVVNSDQAAEISYYWLPWGLAIYATADGAIVKSAVWLHLSDMSWVQLPSLGSKLDATGIRKFEAPRNYIFRQDIFATNRAVLEGRSQSQGTKVSDYIGSSLDLAILRFKLKSNGWGDPDKGFDLEYRALVVRRGILALLGIRGPRKIEPTLNADEPDVLENLLFRQAASDNSGCWQGDVDAVDLGPDLVRILGEVASRGLENSPAEALEFVERRLAQLRQVRSNTSAITAVYNQRRRCG